MITLRVFNRYLWPLTLFWQLVKLLNTCPEMKQVIDRYNFHYRSHTTHGLAYRERHERNMAEDMTLTYGETYWSAFIKIMAAVDVRSDDVFVDLGCGSGQLCFFVHLQYRIPTIGVDLLHGFISTAQQIANELQYENMLFVETDLFEYDVFQGTLFYITCTCFTPDYMKRLEEKCFEVPSGSRIITITQPLYCDFLAKEKVVKGWFSWGMDEAWIYTRI